MEEPSNANGEVINISGISRLAGDNKKVKQVFHIKGLDHCLNVCNRIGKKANKVLGAGRKIDTIKIYL